MLLPKKRLSLRYALSAKLFPLCSFRQALSALLFPPSSFRFARPKVFPIIPWATCK
jgi:hypothetical protein